MLSVTGRKIIPAILKKKKKCKLKTIALHTLNLHIAQNNSVFFYFRRYCRIYTVPVKNT